MPVTSATHPARQRGNPTVPGPPAASAVGKFVNINNPTPAVAARVVVTFEQEKPLCVVWYSLAGALATIEFTGIKNLRLKSGLKQNFKYINDAGDFEQPEFEVVGLINCTY